MADMHGLVGKRIVKWSDHCQEGSHGISREEKERTRPPIIASSRISGRSALTMKCCAFSKRWAFWHCPRAIHRRTLRTGASAFRSCLSFIDSSQMTRNRKCLAMSVTWKRGFLTCLEELKPVSILSKLQRCSARACAIIFSGLACVRRLKHFRSRQVR